MSSIFPKNERKQFDLSYHSSKVEFFRSFFERIEDTKKTFRNQTKMTFSKVAVRFMKKSLNDESLVIDVVISRKMFFDPRFFYLQDVEETRPSTSKRRGRPTTL